PPCSPASWTALPACPADSCHPAPGQRCPLRGDVCIAVCIFFPYTNDPGRQLPVVFLHRREPALGRLRDRHYAPVHPESLRRGSGGGHREIRAGGAGAGGHVPYRMERSGGPVDLDGMARYLDGCASLEILDMN